MSQIILDSITFKSKNYEIHNIDCRDSKAGLESIATDSIDFIITDPPYFIDGMNDKWDKTKLDSKVAKSGVIGSLPIGMKFDKNQSLKLQEFITPIAKQLYRILKPGAFCVIFSQARLYHAMAMSVDLVGFEVRDMLVWKYSGQAKAFSLNHFIDKDSILDSKQKENLKQELKGLKTPQLRPQIEPMVLAQKPRIGTFLQNFQSHKVGLMDSTQSLDSKFPSNFIDLDSINPVFEYAKPKNKVHLTQKPVPLISHLIKLFTRENQVVLDPFLGSGSHAIAALESKRKFIGFEINKEYFDIAKQRIESIEC